MPDLPVLPGSSAHPFQEEAVKSSTYHWLLMLGFPENVAAASMQPKATPPPEVRPAASTSRHPFGP